MRAGTNMVRGERLNCIKELVDAKREASLQDLQEILPDVSLMTIRRDLDTLEQQGFLVRTHGGAVSVQEIAKRSNDDFQTREINNIEAKNLIALKARELVEPGITLYLDAGSTTFCLTKYLPDERYTVITHAPNLALSMMKYNNPTIITVGGLLIRGTLSAAGSMALGQLDQLHIDLAFLSASGYLPQAGFTNSNPFECEVKRKIMERSRRVVMLLDSSKVGKQAAFTFAKAGEINLLITERGLPEAVKTEFLSQKVEVWESS